MKLSRTWVVSAVFVLIAVAVGIWLYPHMPERVPTHWDAHGHANGWSPRWVAAALPVMMVAGLVVLTWLLPVISPRKFEITPFARVYAGLMLAIQGVLLVIGVLAALKGAGYDVPIAMVGMLAVGVLFMVLGNYMGKLRKNFFIGIRTPWTLASDAVWERTHRVGGWTFMVGGLVFVVGGLAGGGPWLIMAAAAIAAVIPAAYSLIAYKRLERRGALEREDP